MVAVLLPATEGQRCVRPWLCGSWDPTTKRRPTAGSDRILERPLHPPGRVSAGPDVSAHQVADPTDPAPALVAEKDWVPESRFHSASLPRSW